MLGQPCFWLYLYLQLTIPYIASHRERWFKSRPTHDEGDDGSETEGSLFEWEEEATLLSDLMEEE